MLDAVARSFERFLGRGDAAITVPPLDGALEPNTALDQARLVCEAAEPDNLVAVPDGILFTSGMDLMHRTDAGPATLRRRFDRSINAAARSPGGRLAVALDDGRIQVDDAPALVIETRGAHRCVTAMTFNGERSLVVCSGSSVNPMADWQRDLLEMERTGVVSVIDLDTGKQTVVADRLYFPYGVQVIEGGDHAVVAESWKNRLIRIDLRSKGVPTVMVDGLPGYPARLSPRHGGGAWLAMFAPRSQLVEFVLREPVYRRTMMAEVDRQFWVAPSLSSGNSFKEPMQGGALRQMGIMKPWAPTRSYGLVVGLDAQFHPQCSFHCRAAGRRHGVTSMVDLAGRLVIATRGGNELIEIDTLRDRVSRPSRIEA